MSTVAAMRWDNLFDDLESQLEHELGAEELDLHAEEERLRVGRLALRDRFRTMLPTAGPREPVRLLLTDGTRVSITVGAVGRDWVAGESVAGGSSAASCVVPIEAISACFPGREQAVASIGIAEDPGGVGTLSSRLGLTFVLRDLCRRRAPLRIITPQEQLHGTIDRVARDHVDLAEHDPDAPRRERAVRAIRLLPIAEIVLIRF